MNRRSKRRFRMIARAKYPTGLARAGRIAVLGVTALLLPLAPSWAQKSETDQVKTERHDFLKTRAEAVRSDDRDTLAHKQQLGMEHLASSPKGTSLRSSQRSERHKPGSRRNRGLSPKQRERFASPRSSRKMPTCLHQERVRRDSRASGSRIASATFASPTIQRRLPPRSSQYLATAV